MNAMGTIATRIGSPAPSVDKNAAAASPAVNTQPGSARRGSRVSATAANAPGSARVQLRWAVMRSLFGWFLPSLEFSLSGAVV
jgi:hypothetical protein